MITIEIKTWKDWKKSFIDWVKKPRRNTCKDYVGLMSVMEIHAVHVAINNVCDKYDNITQGQRNDIVNAIEMCIYDCVEKTNKVIDEDIPVKFF